MARLRKAPDPLMTEIGALLRKRRESLNLDQRGLARKVGCSQQSLSYWETGQVSVSVSKAIRWCEALGLDFWPTKPGGL